MHQNNSASLTARPKRVFRLSLVVPCYNEEAVILLTHEAIIDILGKNDKFDLEIIYVDDGSQDRTPVLLRDLADSSHNVKAVYLARNFGHQPAVSCGLSVATGDVIGVIDADLQDPPDVILDMLEQWQTGYDVVYGVRTKRKETLWRRFAYAAFYRIYRRLANVDVPLDSGDFALIDRRVVDAMNRLPEKNRFLRGLRSWVGFKQTGLMYERHARAAGYTKYPLSKLLQLAMDGIFNFSVVPLSILFLVGIALSLFSFFGFVALLVYSTIQPSFFGIPYRSVPGYASLILSTVLFGGLQIMALGVIGQYVGRIYQEVKARPAFVIREIYCGRTKNDR